MIFIAFLNNREMKKPKYESSCFSTKKKKKNKKGKEKKRKRSHTIITHQLSLLTIFDA